MSNLPNPPFCVASILCESLRGHFSIVPSTVVSTDFAWGRPIPANRMRSLCDRFQCLIMTIYEITIDHRQSSKIYGLPIIALLMASRWRNFGILNTTLGSVRNALFDMSRRRSELRSANSSGNLDIWLCDRFKSIQFVIIVIQCIDVWNVNRKLTCD